MQKNKPDYHIQLHTSEHLQDVFLTKAGHYRIELCDPGVQVSIKGGWHLKSSDQLTITLDIVHQAPKTRSETLLRAVAEDSAKVSLRGTIIVEPQAQNINAFLTENILLLSDTAQAEAIPNLEIEANEVKCSHAATITNINDELLFYFASRGIGEREAKEMIISGFLAGLK